MKITIATILITLAVIGWRMQDLRSDSRLGPILVDAAEAVDANITPDWVPFESAIKSGDTSGRPTMVFIYADWCTWCKKTFAETFTDENVLQYLRENYQVVKLNTEAATPAIVMNEQTITEAQLSQVLGATGLPTYVFLDSQGQPITRTMGYYDAESAMKLLTTIAEN